MLHLTESHMKLLLGRPESGMGYQIIEAFLHNGKKRTYVAFNSELLVAIEELEKLKEYPSYDLLLKKGPLKSSEKEIKGFPELGAWSGIEKSPPNDSDTSTSNPTRLLNAFTSDGESFKRFSAYKNDHRISPQKGLRPGTYATSVSDVSLVPSGFCAVARYALGNPWPAIYVFTITLPWATMIPIQCHSCPK